MNITQVRISVYERVENIAGKGENAGYQHFLLFLQCFQTLSSTGSLKPRIVWKGIKTLSLEIYIYSKSHMGDLQENVTVQHYVRDPRYCD